LNQRKPGKQIAIILDNASIHRSKKTKEFLKRHKNIHLFFLPPYSPEYNPVEIFWRWIKPKVYGFSALGEASVSWFRDSENTYGTTTKKRLINPLKFNLETYRDIL